MTEDLALGEIENVSSGTWTYISHTHRILFGATTLIALSISGYFGLMIYREFTDPAIGTNNLNGTVLLFAVPLIAIHVLYLYFRSQVRRMFMQQLATSIGFTYAKSGDMRSVSGNFFGIGHSQNMYDVLSGTYKNHPMRIYTFRYTVGSGKNQHTYTYTVFEMNCEAALPHVTVNLPELSLFSGMEKVELEGEFSKQFNIHVEAGKQMEIREIFQPDVMADLQDAFSKYSLETSGQMFYLMKSGAINERKTFLDMVAAVDHLFDALIPELDAMARGQGTPVITQAPAATQ